MKFKWRDISDGSLINSANQKIFIKGLNNKVYVRSVKEFLLNSDGLFDYCWLPLYEKEYLFKNLNKAFFDNDHMTLNRRSRKFTKLDIYCFYDSISYHKTLMSNNIF